jgi:hypothetical protein
LFPKRGFLNFTRRTYAPLPLKRLQAFIAEARLDPAMPITVGSVIRSNLVHGISRHAGVKLLGPADPDLPLPKLELELSRFSKSAADAIIAAGGKVTAVYHNNLSLRQEVFPEKFIGEEVKMADPIRRTDLGECWKGSCCCPVLYDCLASNTSQSTTPTLPTTVIWQRPSSPSRSLSRRRPSRGSRHRTICT